MWIVLWIASTVDKRKDTPISLNFRPGYLLILGLNLGCDPL